MKKEDVKTALKNMGDDALYVLTRIGKIILTWILAFLVIVVGVYFVVNFFWQSITVIVMGILCFWFWMELVTVKTIREYDESCHVHNDEPSNK